MISHTSGCPISSTKCQLCWYLLDIFFNLEKNAWTIFLGDNLISFLCSCVVLENLPLNISNESLRRDRKKKRGPVNVLLWKCWTSPACTQLPCQWAALDSQDRGSSFSKKGIHKFISINVELIAEQIPLVHENIGSRKREKTDARPGL